MDEARGTFVFDVVARSCEREQAERDRIAALPRNARRRAATRAMLEQGAASREDLRHIHSVLALCSLPYTGQPIEKREWQRDVGRMSLIIEAGKLQSPSGEWILQPLPFGSRARLLLLHLCSEAVRQKSAEIEIEDSLTGFIRAMGFPVTGGKNGTLQSFKAQVNALAACHMRIGMSDGTHAKTVNTQPFSSIDVWFPSTPDQRMLWPSTITFSQDFFATLTKHALPVNIHAVRDFAGSPRKLDMLFWLGYRLNHLSQPLRISLVCPAAAVGAGVFAGEQLQARFRAGHFGDQRGVPEVAVQADGGGGHTGTCRRRRARLTYQEAREAMTDGPTHNR